MVGRHVEISALIGQFYACVESPARWNDALLTCMEFLGGASLLVFTPCSSPGEGGLHVLVAAPVAMPADAVKQPAVAVHFSRAVHAGLSDHDSASHKPRAGALQARRGGSKLVELVQDESGHSLFCRLLDGSGPCGKQAMFGIWREPDQSPFTDRERGLAEVVLPHIGRAVSLSFQFLQLAQDKSLSRLGWDGLPWAQGLVSGDGRVMDGNKALMGLLAESDSVLLEGAFLSCRSPGDASRVRAALLELAGERGDGAALRVIRVRRASGKADHVLILMALRSEAVSLPVRIQIKVLDPTAHCAVPCEVFRLIYRLTKAECRLLEVLMAGLSPKEAAEQFEVSANTVRSQLKAIYLKTGVHRQVDLLRLAMGLGGVA